MLQVQVFNLHRDLSEWDLVQVPAASPTQPVWPSLLSVCVNGLVGFFVFATEESARVQAARCPFGSAWRSAMSPARVSINLKTCVCFLQMFGVFGAIMSMRVMLDRQGRSKGHALVGFDNPEAAAGLLAPSPRIPHPGPSTPFDALIPQHALHL